MQNVWRFQKKPYLCIAFETEVYGRLAQLVQSIWFTPRGSGVRIPQRPRNRSLTKKFVRLFYFLPLLYKLSLSFCLITQEKELILQSDNYLRKRMELDVLTAISPIDGRYRGKTKALAAYFSEFALIKYRVQVEVNTLSPCANFLCRS